jgi:hypothetical protein
MFTPAPDVAAATWKDAAFASGHREYADVKTERMECAIAGDIAFLAGVNDEVVPIMTRRRRKSAVSRI